MPARRRSKLSENFPSPQLLNPQPLNSLLNSKLTTLNPSTPYSIHTLNPTFNPKPRTKSSALQTSKACAAPSQGPLCALRLGRPMPLRSALDHLQGLGFRVQGLGFRVWGLCGQYGRQKLCMKTRHPPRPPKPEPLGWRLWQLFHANLPDVMLDIQGCPVGS